MNYEADPKQLPFVLKLLDDGSKNVQHAVMKELASYGSQLDNTLEQLDLPPTDTQKQKIQELLRKWPEERLRNVWPNWKGLPEGPQKLEEALCILSDYQAGLVPENPLSILLDELTEEYLEKYEKKDPRRLARFLFQDKKLRGARSDYHNPENSNLVYVIQKKRGLPISLSCVFILVGKRLGISIEGCNLPRHFLARTYLNNEMVWVDCFNGGRFLQEKDILVQAESSAVHAVRTILRMKVESEVIVARILRNMVASYKGLGRNYESSLMLQLLNDLEGPFGPSDFN